MEKWIISTQHMAHMAFDNNQETKESFLNKSAGRISARCFTSQPRPSTMGYRSCLFKIGSVPLMVELLHTRDAKEIAALEASGWTDDRISSPHIIRQSKEVALRFDPS
jgi:hypothetical protein